MTLLIPISALGFIFVLTVGLLLRTMLQQRREPLPDEAWLRSFSAARYRPMLRLLAEDDYEFLLAVSKDPAVVKRLRAERRRIFRMYLNNLVRDFSRLHRAARVLVLEAEEERSDVAERLIRIRLNFVLAVFAVRCRLALHTVGIGTVDVRALIDSLESMKASFTAAQPMTQGAAI